MQLRIPLTMTLVETLVKLFDFVCLFVQIPDPRDPTLGPGGSFEHVQQKKAKGQVKPAQNFD